jgi:hypothetical protein
MDTRDNPVAQARHPRLAALFVWIGLLGAFGGGAEVIRDGLAGSGIDWGALNAFLTFGIVLAAFGACWSHAPAALPARDSRDAAPRRAPQAPPTADDEPTSPPAPRILTHRRSNR